MFLACYVSPIESHEVFFIQIVPASLKGEPGALWLSLTLQDRRSDRHPPRQLGEFIVAHNGPTREEVGSNKAKCFEE